MFCADPSPYPVPLRPVCVYSAGCGHCKRLAPTWEQLETTVGDVANIVSVDCTKNQALCSTHGVKGYPTLKFFQPGQQEGAKYAGGRDLGALEEYVKSNTNKDL